MTADSGSSGQASPGDSSERGFVTASRVDSSGATPRAVPADSAGGTTAGARAEVEGDGGGEAPVRLSRKWRDRLPPWSVLSAMILAFFAVTFATSWASYASITPGGNGGAGDLSVMMQALTSTSHGYIPFYESPDCLDGGRCSFLLVHPALALYALVPVYSVDPSVALLLGAQSAGAALAAVPLYLLATGLSKSRWKGVIAAGVYLIFLPTISSIDFSFHVEPFLPLELFTVFWLWWRQHFWLGGIATAVSILTFDVNSVLIFFFGVFFLWPYFVSGARQLVGAVRRPESSGGIRDTLTRQLRSFFRGPGLRPARAAVALLVLCVAGYLFLRFFVEHSTLFGLPPVPARFLLPLTRPNPQVHAGLAFGGSTTNWILYWLLSFALLGFVGLLVPRTLWLAVPWLAYTAVATSPNYTMLGLHYGSITAVPLVLGFAFGLAVLPLGRTPASLPSKHRARYRVKRAAAWSVLAAVIAVNLALTPLGTLAGPLAQTTLPVATNYPSSLHAGPGVKYLQQLGTLVPQYSVLAAPELLLPFVANDIYAYPYPLGATNNLPFTVPTLPEYVIVDSTALGSLTTPIQEALYNASEYQVRAFVAETSVGPVTLFEKGYTGAVEPLGPSSPFTAAYSPQQIKPHGNATGIVNAPKTPYGSAVESKKTSTAGDMLFATPSAILLPGSYTIEIQLWVDQLNNSSSLDPAFLQLNSTGYDGFPLFSESLLYHGSPTASWFNVTVRLNVVVPVYEGQISGVLTTSHNGYQVQCAGVSIEG